MNDDLVTLPRAELLGLLEEIGAALAEITVVQGALAARDAHRADRRGLELDARLGSHAADAVDAVGIARDLVEATPGEPRPASPGPLTAAVTTH